MRRFAKKLRPHLAALKANIRRLTRSRERAARLSVEQVNLIARRAMPAGSYEIETTLLGHNRRASVYLHAVFSADAEAALKIIEKRTNNRGENSFYRSVRSNWQMAENGFTPEIYSICSNSPLGFPEFRNHFFVEHLPRIGLPELSEETAADLVASMMKIADIPVEGKLRERHASTSLDEGFLERFVRSVTDAGFVGDAISHAELANVRSDWRLILERDVTSARLVPCHNDLHPANLGRRNTSSSDFVFVDWELFALNHLGADLHHFISLGVMKSNLANFSDMVRKQYSERAECIFGVRRRDIDFAAYSYALYRSMLRATRQKDATQARASIALLEKLRTLPCLIATLGICEVIYA
jgi:hypothetical protein